MKVAIIGDIHMGIKNSNQVFQASQLKFFREQLIPELKEKQVKNIFILGDLFDTRQSVNVQTDNAVIELFKNDLKDFSIRMIVGNHDMYHTTTTEVNSLKMLSLLPNVEVYEKPQNMLIDGKKCLFLPWITDYTMFDEIVVEDYDYCFCHADIIGFDMGGGRLSDVGVPASRFLDKIRHTYSGHYHKRHSKEYNGRTIEYIGSPYQLTRIDRNEDRGYTIIDFKTEKTEFVKNTKSILFTKHVYPNIDRSMIAGNVVDIDIPYELQNETKKIYDLVLELEAMKPAYPVNLNQLPKDLNYDNVEIQEGDFNLLTLFKGYIDQLETNVDKTELYNEFMTLYNTYKDDEK